jgi:hypothetical protein
MVSVGLTARALGAPRSVRRWRWWTTPSAARVVLSRQRSPIPSSRKACIPASARPLRAGRGSGPGAVSTQAALWGRQAARFVTAEGERVEAEGAGRGRGLGGLVRAAVQAGPCLPPSWSPWTPPTTATRPAPAWPTVTLPARSPTRAPPPRSRPPAAGRWSAPSPGATSSARVLALSGPGDHQVGSAAAPGLDLLPVGDPSCRRP